MKGVGRVGASVVPSGDRDTGKWILGKGFSSRWWSGTEQTPQGMVMAPTQLRDAHGGTIGMSGHSDPHCWDVCAGFELVDAGVSFQPRIFHDPLILMGEQGAAWLIFHLDLPITNGFHMESVGGSIGWRPSLEFPVCHSRSQREQVSSAMCSKDTPGKPCHIPSDSMAEMLQGPFQVGLGGAHSQVLPLLWEGLIGKVKPRWNKAVLVGWEDR